MALIYVLFIIANLAVAFQPVVLAQIINTIQGGSAAMHDVLMWAALYAVLNVVFWALHGPSRIVERWLGFVIFKRFVDSLYCKITEMPLRWHQDHHSGDTINRVNKAGRALFNFAQEQFSFIQMTARFIVSVTVLGFYSPWVLVTSLAVSFLLAVVIRRFDGELIPLIETGNEREHGLNATLFDYISNIITILTFVCRTTRAPRSIAASIASVRPSRAKSESMNGNGRW